AFCLVTLEGGSAGLRGNPCETAYIPPFAMRLRRSGHPGIEVCQMFAPAELQSVTRSVFSKSVLRFFSLFGYGCWDFAVGEVAGSPQVPAGDGAPRLPFFCPTDHDVGFGEIHGGDFVGGFEFGEGEGEAFADAVVVDGEDVGAAEAEDEKHLYGPAADASDLGEVFDDGFVGHAADLDESGDGAVDSFGGEVAEGEHLVFGEAGGAELLVGAVEEMLRRGMGSRACGFEGEHRGEGF